MVAKMKYISITGHIAHMNHAVSRYLSRYNIQLEQAKHSLMQPFTSLNPYAQTLRKAQRLSAVVGLPPALYVPMPAAEAVNIVEAAFSAYEKRGQDLKESENLLSQNKNMLEHLENFSSMDVNLGELEKMEFIHHRFGRFSVENFHRFEKFLQSDDKILFTAAKKEKDYVYGVFFTPMRFKENTDAVFASLKFEVFSISTPENLTPAAFIHRLRNEARELDRQVAVNLRDTLSVVCKPEKLAIACMKVKNLYAAFDVKKYAAISQMRRIFTFSGWMDADDAEKMEEEIENDDRLLFTRHVFEDHPPVLLKNLPIIRQFEFFTRLYGLPEYGEVDPTPLLAVTYTLLFGLMFGDIGHGAILAIIGIYVQRRRHTNLGGIMTVVGVSAAVFGILYGSVFGMEFRPLWRQPTANIGETLFLAIAVGVTIILISMLLNMYNAFRRKDFTELLFGANGIAGLLFYSAALWLAVRVFVQGRPVTMLAALTAATPLMLVCLKHPLENFICGHGFLPQKKYARFLGNTAMELFETLLSYMTNTISFVRVGAFAVSHAGMMHVVLQLSRGSAGTRNIFILILGNAIVIVIEGLLVGIQVLRLDFYEFFSRFYKGTGKPFVSSKISGNEG